MGTFNQLLNFLMIFHLGAKEYYHLIPDYKEKPISEGILTL